MKRIKTILVQTFNKLKHRVILICCIFSFLNTSAQTWTQRADFGGGARYDAVGFSIGNKGYILGGYNTGRDFWEWDPASNTWTQKADFPGDISLIYAVGFSIGTKGYIGTGSDYLKSFWEWDQATNTWTQKADFGGAGRNSAVGFSIGTKGYIGFGNNGSLYPNGLSTDFWEWDQATNNWTQKAGNTSLTAIGNVGFSIGTKGYIGRYDRTFWEWDQTTNIWTQKADCPVELGYYAVSFVIGQKGYIITGDTISGSSNQLYEYDLSTDTWTQKINFPGFKRVNAVGFSIGNKGYVGTGKKSDGYCSDFWEYCDTCTTNVIGLSNILNCAIYPNPATNQFTFILPQSMNATYSLNDLQGNPAKTGKTTNSQTEINVDDLPRGMYILKVVTDKQTFAKKVLLQ